MWSKPKVIEEHALPKPVVEKRETRTYETEPRVTVYFGKPGRYGSLTVSKYGVSIRNQKMTPSCFDHENIPLETVEEALRLWEEVK